MGRATVSHRRFKRIRRRVGGAVLDLCGPAALGALSRSWRTELAGVERHRGVPAGSGYLVCMWHGRMIVGVPFFRDRGWHVLVSPSEDGDLSEKLLQSFQYKVIRGSASRGGARALREMLGVLGGGGQVVVTPDGPRGPRHSMNPGLAWMARATGYPVLPLGMTCDRAWRMRSWDRFTIPKPRARIVYVWGEPVSVPREAGEAELARVTDTLRERTLAAEREGFARLGVEPDW